MILNNIKAELGYETLIKPKLNDPIVENIVNLIESIKGQNANSKNVKIALRTMSNLILDRFGLPVNVKLNSAPLGYAIIPYFVDDNVLTENQRLPDTDSEKARQWLPANLRRVLKYTEKIASSKIVVDLDKVRIFGIPDTYKMDLYVGTDIVDSKGLTSREITAIILHEIGHAFTLISNFTRAVKNTTPLLEAFLESYNGNVKNASKIILEAFNVDISKGSLDANLRKILNNAKDAITITSNLKLEELKSKAEYARDIEIEADDFAVRFGLGKELVSVMSKIDNYAMENLKALAVFMAILELIIVLYQLVLASASITVLVSAILSLPIATIIWFILLAFSNVLLGTLYSVIEGLNNNIINDEHESNLVRIERIKRGIIRILRTVNLSKKERLKILKDLDAIEAILKKVDMNSSFKNLVLYGSVKKSLNPNYVYTLIMSNLENNDLHYLSEKIKNI